MSRRYSFGPQLDGERSNSNDHEREIDYDYEHDYAHEHESKKAFSMRSVCSVVE